jgi:asparagine synthase (glutamine-hydrolysing)
MSAIAALLDRRGAPVKVEAATRMLEAERARGPETSRVWAEGSVAIGHGLLAVTPEDYLAPQPIALDGGALVVALDGRIDNRDEIAEGLDLPSNGAGDMTDAELLARAYARWGEGASGRAAGDFAAVLWDARAQALVGMRDPLAGRPFYYRVDGRAFRCASSPWALFAGTEDVPAPDLDAVALFLIERFDERSFTLFQGVRALEPGATLRVTSASLRVTPSSWLRRVEPLALRTSAEYEERFLAALREAVRARMRARGRVAVHVSGGVDSSSVAALATEIARERGERPPLLVRCLFPGLPCDERPYSDALAAHLGTPIESVVLPGDLASFAPDPARIPRGVIWNPIPVMLTRLIDLAKERGIRVTLGGAYSDQLLLPTGFELADALLHLDLPAIAELSGLRASSRCAAFGAGYASGAFSGDRASALSVAPLRRIVREGAVRALPPRFRRAVRSLLHRPDGLPGWLTPSAAAAVRRLAKVPPDLRDGDFPGLSARKLATMIAHDADYSFSNALVDPLVAARGADLRSPFFDRRVVELLLSFPGEQRAAAPPFKALLRRAMGASLPAVVRDRVGGAEFSPFVQRAFVEPHGARVAEMLRGGRLGAAGVIDPVAAAAVVERARTDASVVREVLMLASMELWMRQVQP